MLSKTSQSVHRVTRSRHRKLSLVIASYPRSSQGISSESRRHLLIDVVNKLSLVSVLVDVIQRPATAEELLELPEYGTAGPFEVIKLPRLKHTYTTCSTSADRCTLKINAWVPRRSTHLDLKRYPLVIITPGFLIGADQYTSYAERLSSWGYVVVSYDFVQQALDPTTDIDCVNLLEELIEWCRASELLGKISDSNNIMLVGHSRGAKISTLAAIRDTRIQSLFLLDPVDVTVYTPPDRSLYPSATTALSVARPIPICIVGGGKGEDCAPRESNYDLYFKSSRGPTWKTVIDDSGHLQFLDARNTTAMGAFCQAGGSADAEVGSLAQNIMVSWAEMTLARRDETGDSVQRIMKDSQTGAIHVTSQAHRPTIDANIVDEIISTSPIHAQFQSKNIVTENIHMNPS